ncbi:hypothetical protein RsTz2092_13400 [Deferribacterales bacterium RsTz2092]|nr:hypothetical protein AGMMS49941_12620 [Deferribacterales bacterium]
MIEIGKKFPSLDMLERIATALEVDTPELFSMKSVSNKEIMSLYKDTLLDIKKVMDKRLKELEYK